ncbi:MAG TPA: SDR family oxidoreductase [Burkholderiaceae bacterium]|nr:SDR family oxidoreductase [Burkholderiaceae bacterium]
MLYLVTGASGFIGKRLVAALLARPGSRVAVILRNLGEKRQAALLGYWKMNGKADARRVTFIEGDLTQPGLGIDGATIAKFKGKVDHLFHLAAIYDLAADPKVVAQANVDGTRHVVQLAAAIGARRFHHVSSVAAAGLYDGVFREDMFDEAEKLDHPYFSSKHEAERIVRQDCTVPWRIYRPGLVVGDSRTGEMDKIDGPYYFFKLIQRMRSILPPWMPTIGFEGGRINLVPVDFVVAALDHIAHVEGEDGRCFHLTDPHPQRVGEIMGILSRAAHAPPPIVRINASLLNFIPRGVAMALMALTPVRRIRDAIVRDLGLPDGVLTYVNCPTRFDSRDAERVLRPAGIAVPAFPDYAWRLWDYWERHLDPDLFVDRSLNGRVAGRVVLITGGSAGIGKALAFKVAAAGARTIIVGRDAEKLDAACAEARSRGLEFVPYSADIADPAQCQELVERIRAEQPPVDILVNNAGRSIRRSIEDTYERFHDYERTMQLNYFGCLRMTLAFLPPMSQRRSGHVINVSSIGVLTNAPRFSAYVASKSALEAWTRCAASEFLDRGVQFTTVSLPLVRTAMTAPTRLYDQIPMLSAEEAADLLIDAIIRRPVRVATRTGVFGQVIHALLPRVAQIIMNTSFRMFPDSARHGAEGGTAPPTADQIAFAQLLRGIHL